MTWAPAAGTAAAAARDAESDLAPRIVIVGSGIAGLTAAIEAARHRDVEVLLVTKGALAETNTALAQGGIVGVVFEEDRIEDHHRDTMAAGAWLGDPAAVDALVTEGPARIRELAARGVDFDRDADGRLRGGLEGAHSYPRILHAGGDATGAAIEHALLTELRRHDIEVLEHALVTDLIVDGGRAVGVDLLLADGALARVAAEAVVLATGGAGQLYDHSTNARVATADGVAIALRAGAEVADLEFVQFHPTVLAVGAPFLISEAVRGEGAVLLDDAGRRFALDAHPDGELAPRDVLARAIARQVAAQGGRPVRLDATALGRETLTARFPTIDAAVHERGLDWASEPIPVTPAAHYLMGGVVTDLDGRTSLPGLLAAGEVARTGVHGANRLASNSLLEGAVFGHRAGRAARAVALGAGTSTSVAPLASASPSAEPGPDQVAGPAFTRAALQTLMWEHAGLLRTAEGLGLAAAQLAAWQSELAPAATLAEHEDRNLLTVATELVAAALARTESIGAHYRADAADARRPALATEPLELTR